MFALLSTALLCACVAGLAPPGRTLPRPDALAPPAAADGEILPLQHGVPVTQNLANGGSVIYQITQDTQSSTLNVYFRLESGQATMHMCKMVALDECGPKALRNFTGTDFYQYISAEVGSYVFEIESLTGAEFTLQVESAMRPTQQWATKLSSPWASGEAEINFHRLQFIVCPEQADHSPITLKVLDAGKGLLYVSSGEYYIEDPASCDSSKEVACGKEEVVINDPTLDMYRITLFGSEDYSWPISVNFHDGGWIPGTVIDGKENDEFICRERNCGGRFVIDLKDHATHDNLLISATPQTPDIDGSVSFFFAANLSECMSLSPDSLTKCAFNMAGRMLSVSRTMLDNFVNSEANAGRDPVAYLLASISPGATYPGDENWDKLIPIRLVAQYDAEAATSGKDLALEAPLAAGEAKLAGVYFPSILRDAPILGQSGKTVDAYEVVAVFADKASEATAELNLDVSAKGFPASSGASDGRKEKFSLPSGYGQAVLVPIGKNEAVADSSPLFARVDASAKGSGSSQGTLPVTLRAGAVFEIPESASVTLPASSSDTVFMRALITPAIAKSGSFQIRASSDGQMCSSRNIDIAASSQFAFPDATWGEWKASGSGSAKLNIAVGNGALSGPQEGDYVYFRVNSTGTHCTLEVHTGDAGASAALDIGEGKRWNFETHAINDTLKLRFTPNPSAVDGYSGNTRQKGFFELIVNTSNQAANEDVRFNVVLTRKYYDGTSEECVAAGGGHILASNDIAVNYSSGAPRGYRVVTYADLALVETVYITVTRCERLKNHVMADASGRAALPADPGDQTIGLTVLAGTYEEVQGDIAYSIKTPRATGAIQYYLVEATPMHDWTLDLQIRPPTSTSFTVRVCPNYPPFPVGDPEDAKNCLNTTVADVSNPAQFAYMWDGVKYRSGRFYIAISADSAAQETDAHFSLTVRHSARMELERAISLKVLAGRPYYFSARMLSEYHDDSDLLGILGSCRNCVVCYSLTKQHPQFDPEAYNPGMGDAGDCRLLLGILADDDEENPRYEKQGMVDLPAGAEWLFGAVYSLEQPGIAQTVIFTTKVQRRATHDEKIMVNLGYTESSSGESGDDDDESYYYLQHHLKVELPDASASDELLYYTLVVAPEDSNDLMTLATSRYNVFASFVQPAPSFYNAEAIADFATGTIVMPFNQAGIRDQRYLYVTVEATADTPRQFTTTSIAVYTRPDSVIYPLRYMVYNPSPVVPAGQKRVYHFDASRFPLDVRMEPCRGHPMIRAGITDFYRRTDADGSPETTEVEQKERIIARYGVPYGQESPVILRPSTMYMTGSWFFEVGDNRSQLADARWSVSMYASSTDPRPGVPVPTLQLYDAGSGRIEVVFHPAAPSTHGSTARDLEYDVYAMPAAWTPEDYDRYVETGQEGPVDTTAHVPYTSCGMLQGGRSVGGGWRTFDDWDEFFSITTKTPLSELGGGGKYWLTVIARQKNSLLFNSYATMYVDPAAVPARAKGSNVVGIAVGVTLAVGVVVLVATITAVILLRRRAAKGLKAKGEKAFLDLDREALLSE